MNRDEIMMALLMGQVNLSFTKRDGSIRRMEATLSPRIMPQWATNQMMKKKPRTNQRKKKNRPDPDNNVQVWDCEKKSWRSFRINTLLAFNGQDV
jgi:hypothetical protein